MRPLALALVAAAILPTPLAFGAGRAEARLEARLVVLRQTKTDEKYDVEAESDGTTTEGSESQKTEGFDNGTAFPLLGLTVYDNGLVIGTSLVGFSSLFAMSVIVGAELSKTMEAGLFTEGSYSSDKTKTKTEVDGGGSTEDESNRATRDLGIGPYFRFTVPSGASRIEILSILKYLRHQEDSSGSFPDHAERAGFGLTVEPALVVNLIKNAQYFGAVDLSYVSYTSGKKVENSGSTKTTGKLKKGTETSLSVTPLGLRLIL